VGTTATDSSGNGITGTLVNTPTWAAGKISNALSFSGTNQYVSTGTPGSLANLQNSGMTVMAWIRPNSAGGGGGLGRIIDKGNSTSNNGWWFTFVNPTTIRLQVATFGTPVLIRDSTSVVAMSTWQHVAATWDGSKNGTGIHIYVNGVLTDGTTQNATGTAQSDAALTLAIGNRASDGARGFDGLIDDVRIYNAVLSATQIQTIATDGQAPTAPGSPSATIISSSQIDLSWSASTDNVGVANYLVERCSGSSCTNFTTIATPAGTTYSDSGLSASTTYRYRIRAIDAGGLRSAYSTVISATTSTGGGGDVLAPSTPTGLRVIAASSSEIDIGWNASTDNVGVTAYVVERCQGASCSSWSTVATPGAIRFNDPSRSPSTSYSYRVSARDAASNTSPPSSPITYVTPASSPDCR
jgi:chitodextrinase